MDKNLKSIRKLHIQKTMENLEKNNMTAIYADSKEQVISTIAGLLKDGDTVSVGGSMTLFECGIIDFLRSGRYHFLDRYAEGLSGEEIADIYRRSFTADHYFTSTNAITLNGELYNVDGNGNRVAAMIYGPKSVIVVAGINKLVRNIDEAVERVKCIAAPANAVRLQSNTPCARTGYCTQCRSEDRLCSSYVVIGPQKSFNKGRIKVLLVGENLGY
ncbi:MAG TPA: lactate utilization protein [Ruminiclostridium sp.]|nr:lactate utilization protein [Ruminiclostridium sp.]